MDGILWTTACSFVSYDNSFNFCLGFLLVITALQGPWNVTDENLITVVPGIRSTLNPFSQPIIFLYVYTRNLADG